MSTLGKLPALARIELMTLLLLGLIVAVVIIPKCRNGSSGSAKSPENAPKQSVANP